MSKRMTERSMANSCIDTIKVAAKSKSVLRLEKPDSAKKRPIMVIFHSEEEG